MSTQTFRPLHPNTPEALKTGFQGCPVLGVGLGLRRQLLEETLGATDLLDWLEITPENYMDRGGHARQMIERAADRFALVSHGVSMSIGSVDPIDEAYVASLNKLLKHANVPWLSDHLCFSGINGAYFNDLIPLPRTPESVKHIVERIKMLQDRFERPMLIENVSFYLDYPDNTMTDSQFLAEILEQADCGLLLDVNNVYVNSQNHGGDPKAYFSDLPLHRVVQIHMAGHTQFPECIVDTHGEAVCNDVWQLLEWVLDRSAPCGVMIERDLNIPPFSELQIELLRLRALWDAHWAKRLGEQHTIMASLAAAEPDLEKAVA